jgi:hypothetical protein
MHAAVTEMENVIETRGARGKLREPSTRLRSVECHPELLRKISPVKLANGRDPSEYLRMTHSALSLPFVRRSQLVRFFNMSTYTPGDDPSITVAPHAFA